MVKKAAKFAQLFRWVSQFTEQLTKLIGSSPTFTAIKPKNIAV